MKLPLLTSLLLSLAAVLTGCRPTGPDAQHLVILHTNDTHSTIDPDRKDMGGIARRKVLIDSVRAERDNVLVIDAGDAVQGSLYFTLFKGEVERRLMNELGYDIRILGNHEFDNGLESLAEQWKHVEADRLNANYDFTGTALEGVFTPTVIKKVGGHRIGFIGLGLDPAGMISEENYAGMTYRDAIESANIQARKLKEDGAEMVIAVTHLGYENSNGPDDVTLARQSKDIDVIIGGHTHTTVDPNGTAADAPSWQVKNAIGKPVTVLQTGSHGTTLGEVDINLADKTLTARLIPVDSRLDSRIDPAFEALVAPYRAKVDSVKNHVIGTSPVEYERKSVEMLNLMSDFVRRRGAEISGKPVDIAIMNKGGIRNSLAAGPITQGEIIDIAPFNNRVVVMEISGKDLLENLAIMAAQDGNGLSGNVKVLYDPSTYALNSATIDDTPIDPAKTYRLATIDYLAAGNDYMTPLKRGVIEAKSREILYESLIDAIASGRMDPFLATPDKTPRMNAF